MASGYVDFPDYMKAVHEDWIRQTADTVTSSITDLINDAIASSPYDSRSAFDPATKITAMETAVTAFNTRVDNMAPDTDWSGAITTAKTAIDSAIDDTYFEDMAVEVYNYADDHIENTVLPAFKGGMRDVNAVMTSAFVIGEATIRAFAMRDANKIVGDMKGKHQLARMDMIFKGADRIVQSILSQIELEKAVAHYTMEANRMGIAAEKDQEDGDLAIMIGRDKWAFDAFQYGANLMASISGGTAVPPPTEGPSTARSAIGGALAGAAAGSAIGGAPGAAIGGLIGLGSALL